jgi:ABC-2 type transport system permease protein
MMKSLRKCWAIAKKDIRIYYLKGPVLIFGILFPTFLFLAFVIGRNVPPANLGACLRNARDSCLH